MDVVRKDVELLVEKELKAANENNPLFHSMHEGYAVILEEVEEADLELFMLKDTWLSALWYYVKNDEKNECVDSAENLKKFSVNLAIEAIQVAAMAQKFIDSKGNFPKEEID